MSNLIDNAYTQLNNLTQINADDIQTETINTKALYINNILFDPSGIDISDLVTTSQLTTQLTPINNNIATNTMDISGLKYRTTNFSFNASTNTTSVFGLLSLPDSSINSSAINNTSFVSLTLAQTVAGSKQFNAVTRFLSNIRCDAGLTVNNNTLTITNAQLQLIPNIGTLNTKTTNMTYSSLTNQTSFSNLLEFTGTLNGFSFSNFNNAINRTYGLTSDCQTQINSINTSLGNYVLSSSLSSQLSNYVTSSGLILTLSSYITSSYFNSQLSNYVLSSYLSSQLSNYVTSTTLSTTLNNYVLTTALNTALNPINTDISTLNTKTQYISSTSLNTTILNTTNVSDLLISLTINGFSKADFNNVITQCSSLTSNCQNQINDAINKASSAQNKADTAKTNADNAQGTANTALALATTANGLAVGAGALAGTAQTTASGAASGLAALTTTVEGIETDVTALQLKTTQISYSLATERTTISQTLNSPFLEIGNLTSGFTQTSTDQITLAGLLRCNNRVEINNTLELVNNNSIIVEGIINQDNANPPNNGVNQFLAPTHISHLTCSGTVTNINSTNCNITSNTIIKNISTSSSGVIPPYLSVLSTINNANPRILQGILIGRESNNQESNCNIGYNWVSNANLNNYGYLGLNVNTANIKESFRWFDGGCSIPTGNLTISVGNLTVTAGNISLPTGNLSLTNGDITLTNGNIDLSNGEIKLTHGDFNLVSGDAVLTSGNLSLGTGDIDVNNGDLNILNGELKTNTITKYSGSTLDINSPTINIGYNEGLAAINTINIGSTTSFSTINLNGIVVSAFGMNLTGAFSQW